MTWTICKADVAAERFDSPGGVVSETFKRNWWRYWIRSSDGYAIRVRGRAGIEFRDELGEIHINSEAMAYPSKEIVVYARSIPDTDERRPKAEVLDRLQRALAARGYEMKVLDAD